MIQPAKPHSIQGPLSEDSNKITKDSSQGNESTSARTSPILSQNHNNNNSPYKISTSDKNFSKHEHILVAFWNVNDIQNLFNIDTDTQIKFLHAYVLCFSETWCCNDINILPLFLNKENLNVIYNPATNGKSKHHPSAGLAVFIKKKSNVINFCIRGEWPNPGPSPKASSFLCSA